MSVVSHITSLVAKSQTAHWPGSCLQALPVATHINGGEQWPRGTDGEKESSLISPPWWWDIKNLFLIRGGNCFQYKPRVWSPDSWDDFDEGLKQVSRLKKSMLPSNRAATNLKQEKKKSTFKNLRK